MVRDKPNQENEAQFIAKETVLEEAAPIAQVQETFDQARLQDVLDGIIHEFKEKKKNMETAVIKQPFEISEQKIIFFLNGEIQKDIFLKLKPELIALLRQSLQNHKVEISFQIKEEAVNSAKLYTSTDKLMYLREKSPALKELQKRFGLKTDF